MEGRSAGQVAEIAGKARRQRAKKMDDDLKNAIKNGPVRDTAMAVHDDPETGDTQIRVRGVEKQRGETVPRGFLRVAMQNRQRASIPDGGERSPRARANSDREPARKIR